MAGRPATIGRPVAYRTLFSGVDMIPGGTRLTVRDGEVSTRTVWSPPEADPLPSWDDYTRLQAEAFRRTFRKNLNISLD